MNIIRQPSSDVDTLEGALCHMLQVCDTLPAAAINVFAQKFAILHGQKVSDNFGTNVIMRNLRQQGFVYQTTQHLYSNNPIMRINQKGIDAFWVFMEHMQGVDLQTVYKPAEQGSLAYTKNGKHYVIIRCKGNGAVELGTACQQEVKVNRYNKRHPEFKREDRYFFIFYNKEDIMNAPYLLKSPTLFCTIKYNKQWVPELRFVNPDIWRKRHEEGSST